MHDRYLDTSPVRGLENDGARQIGIFPFGRSPRTEIKMERLAVRTVSYNDLYLVIQTQLGVVRAPDDVVDTGVITSDAAARAKFWLLVQ